MGVSAGNGIGGGNVFGSILHAAPTVTLESGHGAGHSVSISQTGSDVVQGKATLEISVTDKRGVNPNPAGGVTFEHEATLAFPHEEEHPLADTPPRPVRLDGTRRVRGRVGARHRRGLRQGRRRPAPEGHRDRLAGPQGAAAVRQRRQHQGQPAGDGQGLDLLARPDQLGRQPDRLGPDADRAGRRRAGEQRRRLQDRLHAERIRRPRPVEHLHHRRRALVGRQRGRHRRPDAQHRRRRQPDHRVQQDRQPGHEGRRRREVGVGAGVRGRQRPVQDGLPAAHAGDRAQPGDRARRLRARPDVRPGGAPRRSRRAQRRARRLPADAAGPPRAELPGRRQVPGAGQGVPPVRRRRGARAGRGHVAEQRGSQGPGAGLRQRQAEGGLARRHRAGRGQPARAGHQAVRRAPQGQHEQHARQGHEDPAQEAGPVLQPLRHCHGQGPPDRTGAPRHGPGPRHQRIRCHVDEAGRLQHGQEGRDGLRGRPGHHAVRRRPRQGRADGLDRCAVRLPAGALHRGRSVDRTQAVHRRQRGRARLQGQGALRGHRQRPQPGAVLGPPDHARHAWPTCAGGAQQPARGPARQASAGRRAARSR